MGEPGILTLGVTSRRLLSGGNRFGQSRFASKIGRDFRHPDPAHYRQARIEIPGKQSLDLLDRAVVDHALEAHVAPGIKPVARGEEDQRVKIDRAAYPPDAFPLPFGDRPT